jgi:queuosine precursor transporter
VRAARLFSVFGRPSLRNLEKTEYIMRLFPAILAMAAIVVASNILVQFLAGPWLTWGAFTYPFAFLVTDLTNRAYGASAARRVVLAGFGVGLVCSLIGTQVMGEFGPFVTLRVALGSGLAFLCAQLMDVAVFDRLRAGSWWKAPLISTLIGSSLDTAVFFTVAFSATLAFIEPGNDVSWATSPVALLGMGPEAPLWVSLAIADWGVKLLLALVALVPFRLLAARVGTSVT